MTQFSRRRQLTLADVELSELLEESLELVAEQLREKRAPVEKRFDAEALRGHWDADQLRQVFVNLLANAVDAGPSGSPVSVTTERATLTAGDRRNGERGRAVAGGR